MKNRNLLSRTARNIGLGLAGLAGLVMSDGCMTEYNPQTGEVIYKAYDPITGFAIQGLPAGPGARQRQLPNQRPIQQVPQTMLIPRYVNAKLYSLGEAKVINGKLEISNLYATNFDEGDPVTIGIDNDTLCEGLTLLKVASSSGKYVGSTSYNNVNHIFCPLQALIKDKPKADDYEIEAEITNSNGNLLRKLYLTIRIRERLKEQEGYESEPDKK